MYTARTLPATTGYPKGRRKPDQLKGVLLEGDQVLPKVITIETGGDFAFIGLPGGSSAILRVNLCIWKSGFFNG